MSTSEQAARQAAEWILEPRNAAGRPGAGEKLWLSVVNGRVVCWQAAETPHSETWVGVTWRDEYDTSTGRAAPLARQALVKAIAAAIKKASKREAEASEAVA